MNVKMFQKKNNGVPVPLTVYVSGPLDFGARRGSEAAMRSACEAVRHLGGYPIRSYLLDDPAAKWEQRMKIDLEGLLRCDRIVLLEGWEDDRASSLEHYIACELGIKIVFWCAVEAKLPPEMRISPELSEEPDLQGNPG